MGRYLTPTDSGAGGPMRSEFHVIESSTPALPIPAWAKLARITGVGGGAGGGNRTDAGVRGAGGGSGGIARNVLLPIDGEGSVSIAIGAGGAGAAGGSASVGGNGGNTVISIGSKAITLFGGIEGSMSSSSARYADARMGSPGQYAASTLFGDSLSSGANTWGVDAVGGIGLYPGLAGARGDSGGAGAGCGAASPFGPGGAAVAYPVAADTVGANGIGHGSGGAGGHGTGKGGDGVPGIVILEFLEAL